MKILLICLAGPPIAGLAIGGLATLVSFIHAGVSTSRDLLVPEARR